MTVGPSNTGRPDRRATREWIFDWRGRAADQGSTTWMALGVVTIVFVLMIGAVRIRIAATPSRPAQQASAARVTDDSIGRMLRLLAREGGPFPSRFDPGSWDAYPAIERPAIEPALPGLTPYQPVLLRLPEHARTTPPTNVGMPVLPRPPKPDAPTPTFVRNATIPTLTALTGIRSIDLPLSLPNLPDEVMSVIAAALPNVLIHIDRSGAVLDATILDPLDPGVSALLRDWMRGLIFQADDSESARRGVVIIGTQPEPANGADPD